MEFFERAHVAHKDSSKKENRSELIVKKQLKQMMHAYKRGNIQEIKSSLDTEPNYDIDDVKSVSDFLDGFNKEDENFQETVSSQSHASKEILSSTSNSSSCSHGLSSSQLNVPQQESSDSLESITDYKEYKSLSSSQDLSTIDREFSSTLDSSFLSEVYSDSEISLASSLQNSSGYSDSSEAFDPDGELAVKIFEKLGTNLKTNQKRKLAVDYLEKNSNKEKKKVVKESVPKEKDKKEGKMIKKTPKTEVTNTKVFRVESKNVTDKTYSHMKSDTSQDLVQENSDFEDSQSSDISTQFISISASDVPNQSLSDIIGDYVHPTARNLPSESQNIVYSYPNNNNNILDEVMNVETEEISSLVPEIDDDLGIDALTLETEPSDESTSYDTSLKPKDDSDEDSSTITFDPKSELVKVYSCRDHIILVMKYFAQVFVHGKVMVTPVQGAVELFGYTLVDQPIELYAPYSGPAYCISTIKNEDFNTKLNPLSLAGLTAWETEEIMTTVRRDDAVIALSKLNSAKIDFVDNNFTATQLFTKRGDLTPKFQKNVSEDLGFSVYLDQPKKVLEKRCNWEQVVACGKKYPSRGVICGGKGTGKSTFLRYCINRLINDGPVLVIDLDPGQAEFTMPGNISANIISSPLIGPNFTHLMQPVKMLNIGMINPMDNPARYISAAKELIEFCYSMPSYPDIPWLVNTMGLCNHMGLKFISTIIYEVQPTFVYQIDSKVAKKRFEIELQCQAVTNFYKKHNMKVECFRSRNSVYSLFYTFILETNGEAGKSLQNGNWRLFPKEERYLNVLAYFGQMLNFYQKTILDIVPFEVDLRNLNIGVNVKIPELTVEKVINGKIIALCKLASTDKGKVFTLDDKAIECFGYGLVRGIDVVTKIIYVLTPVPKQEMKHINTLVYADWMPELQGLEKELPNGSVIPYRSAAVFHEGRLMSSPRRRFNPIQLLKATKSA